MYGSPVWGAAPLLGQDRGDGPVVVVAREPAYQLHAIFAGGAGMATLLGHRHGQLGGRTALPDDPQRSDAGVGVDGEGDLGDDRAQQLFAFHRAGGGRVEDGAHVRARSGDPGQFGVAECDWSAGSLGGQVVLRAALRGQLVFQRLLQSAGDQPVLRLHGVELSQRTVGFESSPFHGELERGQLLSEVGVGVGQGLRGGAQRGWFEHREQLRQNRLFQPTAADALAAVFAGIQLLSAGAHIARAVAGRAGVAGLHDPAAAAAAQ